MQCGCLGEKGKAAPSIRTKGEDADLPRAEFAAWRFFIDAVGSFLLTMPEHRRKPKEGL